MLQREMVELLNARLEVDGAGSFRVDVEASGDGVYGSDWWETRATVVLSAVGALGPVELARATSEPIKEGQTPEGPRYVFDDEGVWHELLEAACHHAQATLILLGSSTRLALHGVCAGTAQPRELLNEQPTVPIIEIPGSLHALLTSS